MNLCNGSGGTLMISEEQINDLIESNEDYAKAYFIWQMDEENTNLEQFYIDEIAPELDECVIALMQETGDFYSDCEGSIGADKWLILTDSEADIRCTEYAEIYAEDARSEIPRHLQIYFDENKYIEDFLDNGRGELLASYDGAEREQEVNGTTYYLYKC